MNDLSMGEIVTLLRKREKMSQGELGAKAGVHRNTISAIENGNTACKVSTLIDIFAVFGYVLNIELAPKKEPKP